LILLEKMDTYSISIHHATAWQWDHEVEVAHSNVNITEAYSLLLQP